MSTETVAGARRKDERLPSPRRAVWAAVGLLSLGVGVVGIFVPGLPTTIFVLGAAWCFARSSPALENWLREHRVFAPYLRMAGQGMPRRAKAGAILLMWASIGLSLWLTQGMGVPLRALLIVLGIVGTWYIAVRVRGAAD